MILDKIITQTKQDLVAKKNQASLSQLLKQIEQSPKLKKDVLQALRKNEQNKQYNVIAEVKKASPSKGVIREDFNPLEIAIAYEKAGASAISVLTEEHFFLGSLAFLQEISQHVQIPLLRKDFILDPYQIAEAYIHGADLVLLIAKCLDEKSLQELHSYAYDLELEVLVEVHDEEDLQKALQIDANIIGVNHRNLDDFSMDMELTQKLKAQIPNDKILIAESGLADNATLSSLDAQGIDGFLIGEHFMRQDNIENFTQSFITK